MMKWIDTYCHTRVLSFSNVETTPSRFVNNWLDENITRLGKGRIGRAYDITTDLFNLRDNFGLSSNPHWANRLLQKSLLISNFGFAAAQRMEDLQRSMKENDVKHALVANMEPYHDAEEMLASIQGKSNLSAIIHLERDTRFESRFWQLVEMGAKALHIHPTLERISADNPHYDRCAELCREADIPLVCRTGITYYPGDYDPAASEIEKYASLVKRHPGTQFIMSHSNLGDWPAAIDFAVEHKNVMLDTAWQTAKAIQKILEELGSERLMLASDWPLLGNQQKVQRRIASGLKLKAADRENIYWRNAERIFKMKTKRAEAKDASRRSIS